MASKWVWATARFSPSGAGGAAGRQPDALLATPKGVPPLPPQGQNWVSTPCGGSLLQKGKNCGSPGFAKPGADQYLDPPALLAAMDTPLAFGMVGDFPLCIAEKIPISVSFQILTSSLVFQGGLPPVFRRIFALCPAFQRRVGYLPYPRGKSGTQGRQRLLLFQKCISSYKPGFPKCRNDFLNFVPVPQKKQNSIAVTLP